MEKAKLTKEQADRLEKLKVNFTNEEIVRTKIQGKLGQVELAEVGSDSIIRALYIGYEVIPDFKEGDWVALYDRELRKDIIVKVHKKEGDMISFIQGTWVKHALKDDLRHATSDEISEEKEHMWWGKQNRHTWELRVGDILTGEDRDGNSKIYEVKSVCNSDIELMCERNSVLRFTLEYISNEFTVTCFVEDRKDVVYES